MPKIDVNKDAKINQSYKPSDREQKYREHVYQRKYDMEQAPERQRAVKIWDQGEKQWDQYRGERDADDWTSDYYVPMTTSVVEAAISEMVDQLPRPFVMPRSSDDVYRARIAKEIFEYSWDVANGDEEAKTIIRGGVTHGTAIAQESYLKDRRMVKDITGLSAKKNEKKQRQFEGEEREVLEYDDVVMEWVSPYDFLVDENAREINRGSYKARDCIRRFVTSYEDAEAFFAKDPVWDHLNNFRYVNRGGDTNYYQYYKPPEGSNKSGDVEVLWYWARTPEDLLIVTINDVVVRLGPNIYKHKQLPFAKVVDVERLGKFYGKGEPELLCSIQEEANMLRRMIIDRNHLDIDKMFTGPNTMQYDEDDLIARPHGFIPGEDLKAIEYGDIPLSVDRTFRSINDDKISVTGIDERFQSVQRAPSTATEAAILKESTLKRVRMKLKNFETGFLRDIGRMRLSNILQFYPQAKLEKIVGEKGTEEFKRRVAQLSNKGMLETRGGEMYQKQYRQITLEGKEMYFDERGNPKIQRKPGFSFFEAKPEYFMPVAVGGYDIKFEAGPSMPVSKPLMQQNMLEAFDRVSPFAVKGLTKYDPEKLVDELVIRPAELNPEDLKMQEETEGGGVEDNRLQLNMDMAGQENQMVMNGEPIPPMGTPYAAEPHTRIHLEFMKSEVGKQMDEQKYKLLAQHVMGETMAIQQREGAGGGATQGMGGPPNQGTQGMTKQNVMPGMIEGGAQVPTGRALGNG